jgi:hypothetical protein
MQSAMKFSRAERWGKLATTVIVEGEVVVLLSCHVIL